MSRLRRKAYVDLDPGFTQFWHADGTGGARLEGHDALLHGGREHRPPGLRRSRPAGIDWRPVRAAGGARGVAGRRRRRPGSLHDGRGLARARSARSSFDGRTYGLKVHEFRKVIELPRRVAAALRDRARHPSRRRARPRGARGATAGTSSTRARPSPGRSSSATTCRARAPSSRSRRASTWRRTAAGSATAPCATWPRAARRSCRTPASARTYPVGEGLLAFRDLDGGGRGRAADRRRLRAPPRAPRARSPRSTSTPTRCCPASSRRRAIERLTGGTGGRRGTGGRHAGTEHRADGRVPARADGRVRRDRGAVVRGAARETRPTQPSNLPPLALVGPGADGVRLHRGRVLAERHPRRCRRARSATPTGRST